MVLAARQGVGMCPSPGVWHALGCWVGHTLEDAECSCLLSAIFSAHGRAQVRGGRGRQSVLQCLGQCPGGACLGGSSGPSCSPAGDQPSYSLQLHVSMRHLSVSSPNPALPPSSQGVCTAAQLAVPARTEWWASFSPWAHRPGHLSLPGLTVLMRCPFSLPWVLCCSVWCIWCRGPS